MSDHVKMNLRARPVELDDPRLALKVKLRDCMRRAAVQGGYFMKEFIEAAKQASIGAITGDIPIENAKVVAKVTYAAGYLIGREIRKIEVTGCGMKLDPIDVLMNKWKTERRKREEAKALEKKAPAGAGGTSMHGPGGPGSKTHR